MNFAKLIENKKTKQILFFAIFMFTMLQFVSCDNSKKTTTSNASAGNSPQIGAQTYSLLNTVCGINLYKDGTKELYEKIFNRLTEIDRDFNAHSETSFISQINQAAGKKAVEVPADVYYVIATSLEYSRLTGGAFDPTVGPLVELWGINTDFAHVPSKKEIEQTALLVNWQDVEITPNTNNEGGNVMLRREGMALDLGGIAKGYAADEVVKIVAENNVSQAIVDLGGNIYVYGKKQDGSLWRVGVKNPNDPNGTPAMVLSLENSTVVTSGVYERFFIEDGIRYHHILDTKTGIPAQTGLLACTIICESSMTADALSTSMFLLGKENGIKFLRELAAENKMAEVPGLGTGVSGIFITEDGNVTASDTLRGALVTTAEYRRQITFE